MSNLLSTDLDSPTSVLYFLWDASVMVAELKRKLNPASVRRTPSAFGENLACGAGTEDAWLFPAPQEVWQNWDALEKHLGRRREFWKFLFEFWEREGLLG
jgi:hypothetical protein